MTGLADRRCVACAKGTPPLSKEAQSELGASIPNWENVDGVKLRREYRFKSYLDGVAWVQQVGEIAELEDHHPEIKILYRKVQIEVWTHTVNGLSDNDYILAAKLDRAYEEKRGGDSSR
jgi:4a-hydroxytetrahydrobiopterin dehydratase